MPTTWSQRCLWLSALFFLVTVIYNARHFAGIGSAADADAVHDFGTLFSGETRGHVFRVKNAWNGPLVVDGVVTECGCTVVEAELKGKTVDVGSVIEVPVRWTAAYKEGDLTKRVLVYFTDSERPPLRLTMKARVKLRFVCSPERIAIEAVSTNDAQSQTFTVTQVPGAPPFDLRA